LQKNWAPLNKGNAKTMPSITDRTLNYVVIALIFGCVGVLSFTEWGEAEAVAPAPQVPATVDGIPFVDTWTNTEGVTEFYGLTMDGRLWACRNTPQPQCVLIWVDKVLSDRWEAAQKAGPMPNGT
jgi:hypothetical protein